MNLLRICLSLFFIPAVACAGERQSLSIDETLQAIKANLTTGLSRSEVESRLKAIPLRYAYVGPSDLQLEGATEYQGTPLGGRVDIVTDVERSPENPALFREGFIKIMIDTHDRVIAIDITGFGIPGVDAH